MITNNSLPPDYLMPGTGTTCGSWIGTTGQVVPVRSRAVHVDNGCRIKLQRTRVSTHLWYMYMPKCQKRYLLCCVNDKYLLCMIRQLNK